MSLRIATVYKQDEFENFTEAEMSCIRWSRISEALAARGFQVDMIVNNPAGIRRLGPRLRHVPFSRVCWDDYDIIKTEFHRGFESLMAHGGHQHPFVVSKLGSVVGSSDDQEGVYFFGEERRGLHELQVAIQKHSRFVTILTEPSRRLWESEHGSKDILMVPTGVDRHIPAPVRNPYTRFKEKIAVYIGNLYRTMQRKVNLVWQNQLNRLGRSLRRRGIRLCVIGPGRVDRLHPDAVTYLGWVDHREIWDYQYFADVGVVLAQGRFQHNESSKIYYYLRTGLPVVSESPVPNNGVIEASGLGLVARFADHEMMAEMIQEAASREWDRRGAIAHILRHHTWDRKVRTYDRLIRKEFGLPLPPPSPC